MKLAFCLFLLILLLQLIIPGDMQCSLDAVVDEKINAALSKQTKKLTCTSIILSGKLASCPTGSAVTSCTCGYGCGSWVVQNGNTCHCQCNVVGWTAARCCHLS
ncbi:PREDICTED: resistin-like beta [Elephantulus edwardii]|uniref:resistin-like beta n=1 Tax=Elephantulus edwardii TaxID=28737 RepID=UPI0003F0E8E3|nr:PREDICTED: resistin-like beta [Elephantulus edwardii]